MKRSNTDFIKNQHNEKLSKDRKRKRYTQTGAIVITAVAVLAGIILIAALGSRHAPVDSSSSDSSTSAGMQSTDSISSQASSASENSSSLPASSSNISSAVPTPTKVPAYSSDGSVSTKREGWYYSPSGKQGVPANATTAYKALCDRFDGIWQGDTTKKKVYITMDVGYDNNGTTAKMLDIAKEKNIKITFFITGDLFKTESLKALVLRMVNEGHLVGNHTWSHPSLPTLLNDKGADAVSAELDKIEKAYKEVTGQEISHYMRPPMGEFSEATMKMMQKRGYKTVFWSFAYKDWDRTAQPDIATAKKTILAGLHNGVVYLIHAVSSTNVAVLPDIIDEIRAQGYEFGLVNEIK